MLRWTSGAHHGTLILRAIPSELYQTVRSQQATSKTRHGDPQEGAAGGGGEGARVQG